MFVSNPYVSGYKLTPRPLIANPGHGPLPCRCRASRHVWIVRHTASATWTHGLARRVWRGGGRGRTWGVANALVSRRPPVLLGRRRCRRRLTPTVSCPLARCVSVGRAGRPDPGDGSEVVLCDSENSYTVTAELCVYTASTIFCGIPLDCCHLQSIEAQSG